MTKNIYLTTSDMLYDFLQGQADGNKYYKNIQGYLIYLIELDYHKHQGDSK